MYSLYWPILSKKFAMTLYILTSSHDKCFKQTCLTFLWCLENLSCHINKWSVQVVSIYVSFSIVPILLLHSVIISDLRIGASERGLSRLHVSLHRCWKSGAGQKHQPSAGPVGTMEQIQNTEESSCRREPKWGYRLILWKTDIGWLLSECLFTHLSFIAQP